MAVHVEIGMVLEDVSSGWVGAVTRVEKSGGVYLVELEDRRGVRRSFPLGPGFWLEGRPIDALPPDQRIGAQDHQLRFLRAHLLRSEGRQAIADLGGGTPRRRARSARVG